MAVFFVLAVLGAMLLGHTASELAARSERYARPHASHSTLVSVARLAVAMLIIGFVGFIACQIRALIG